MKVLSPLQKLTPKKTFTAVATRSEQTDINEDVTFTVEVNAVYSGDVDGQDEISFVTGGNSAICGVDLTIGEEYLLGLYPAGEDPFDSGTGGGTAGQLTVGLCDLARVWSDVPDDEKADLEAGCDECDVSCGEFQVCDPSCQDWQLCCRCVTRIMRAGAYPCGGTRYAVGVSILEYLEGTPASTF